MQIEKHLNLSTENRKQLEEILNRYDESEFLKFCVINEIFEEGLRSLPVSRHVRNFMLNKS